MQLLRRLLLPVDALIDRIGMYRLVLYYLRFLVAAAAVLSFFHVLHYNALEIVASAVGLVAVCWGANWVFGRWFNAPTNHESATITALILTLIITPDLTPVNVLFMIAAGGLAMLLNMCWRSAANMCSIRRRLLLC